MSKLFELIEINPGAIKVEKRARRDLGNLETLKHSIQNLGLLNPILINSEHQLIAGERRLRACMELNLPTIVARIIPDLSKDKEMVIERIENVARKEFTWSEELMLRYKIHLYWVENNTKWSIKKTAKEFNCSDGGLATDFVLADGIIRYPNLKLIDYDSKSRAKETYKKIINETKAMVEVKSNFSEEEQERIAKLMQGDTDEIIKKTIKETKEETLIPVEEKQIPMALHDNENIIFESKKPRPDITYSIESYSTFIEKIPNNSVGMIEIDPPYAIDFENTYLQISKKKVTSNDWTVEKLFQFYNKMLPIMYKKLTDDSWILCWTGKEHWIKTNQIATKHNFIVQSPGVWKKTGGGGSNKPSYNLVSNYENYLLLRKGKATFNTGSLPAAVDFPTIHGTQKIHQWEKPIELYKYFIKALGKPKTVFLSPFAGSGNSLIAAALLDMFPFGCDISQNYFYLFHNNLNNYFLPKEK
jgi:ParB/RepB/Spo0J family partition protein